MSHHELSRYAPLRQQVLELDENISEAEEELDELNKYNINVSPILTGMPIGNEKRDKIADFIIKLETDRSKLIIELAALHAERTAIAYTLYKIRRAVSKIADEQLQQIIKWHYFEGKTIDEIADKANLTIDGVYKKVNRFLNRKRKK